MANPDVPNGLKPVVGDGRLPRINTYKVAAGYGSVIGQHGPVILVAGFVQQAATPLAADKTLLGVACHNVQATGVERSIAVYDDPDQEFEGQFNDNTITTEATVVGNNFAITGVAAINAVTGFSQVYLYGAGGGRYILTNPSRSLRVS